MSVHSTPLNCPSNQFTLPLPDDLEDHLNKQQKAKILEIQLQFSLDVAVLISNAVGDVLAVVRDDDEEIIDEG